MNWKEVITMTNEERIEKIILSTGNVNKPYIVRNIIFATTKVKDDLFDSTNDPNLAMRDIVYKLKQKATEYGADAVINCHFEHQEVEKNGQLYLEVFAYGTVVQFTQSTIGG